MLGEKSRTKDFIICLNGCGCSGASVKSLSDLELFFVPIRIPQEINIVSSFCPCSPPPRPPPPFPLLSNQSKMSPEAENAVAPEGLISQPQGRRKNGKSITPVNCTRVLTPLPGKQWHEPKAAFRPKAGNSSFEKRQGERKAMAAVKAKEKEMKDEKEAERQVSHGCSIYH